MFPQRKRAALIRTALFLCAGRRCGHARRCWLASIVSSSVFKPVVGADTSTAMLPGLCSLRIITMCAFGICSQENTSDMHGSMRRSTTSLLACDGLLQIGEVRALDALLMHPEIARVHGEVVARRAGADHDHAAALHHLHRDRERRLARMLEHEVDVDALAGDVPDRLAEARASLSANYCTRACPTFGSCPQHLKSLRLMTPLAPSCMHEIALVVIRDHADRIGARRRAELDRERAKTAGSAPHQHVVARTQHVRTMAEQHAVGGGERQRVAGALFPGEMLRALASAAGPARGRTAQTSRPASRSPRCAARARTSDRRRCTPRRRRRPGCSG